VALDVHQDATRLVMGMASSFARPEDWCEARIPLLKNRTPVVATSAAEYPLRHRDAPLGASRFLTVF